MTTSLSKTNVDIFIETIDSILLEMKKKGILSLESIFVNVIWAFAKVGDIDAMVRYYESLKKDIRCPPDVFTTMIHGLGEQV